MFIGNFHIARSRNLPLDVANLLHIHRINLEREYIKLTFPQSIVIHKHKFPTHKCQLKDYYGQVPHPGLGNVQEGVL